MELPYIFFPGVAEIEGALRDQNFDDDLDRHFDDHHIAMRFRVMRLNGTITEFDSVILVIRLMRILALRILAMRILVMRILVMRILVMRILERI